MGSIFANIYMYICHLQQKFILLELFSMFLCDIVVLKYFSMCIEVTLLNAGGEKAKMRALHVVIY